MKNITKIIFGVVLLLLGFTQTFAQTDLVNGVDADLRVGGLNISALADPNTNVILETDVFDLNIGFTYEVGENYQIVVELPAGVTYMGGENADIFSGSSSASILDIEVTSAVNASMVVLEVSNSTNEIITGSFNLVGLRHDIEQICGQSQNREIKVTGYIFDDNNIQFIDDETPFFIVPALVQTAPSIQVFSFLSNQEDLTTSSNTSKLPFYVEFDFRQSGSFEDFPIFSLNYPTSKLQIINAYQYSENPDQNFYFHENELTENIDYTTKEDLSGIDFVIDGNSSLVNAVKISSPKVRVYFRVLDKDITNEEINIKVLGGTWLRCDEMGVDQEVSVDVPMIPSIVNFTVGNLKINETNAILLPSFETDIDSKNFCSGACDFDPESVSSIFHFESNVVYTEYSNSAEVPNIMIRINDPLEISLKKLAFAKDANATMNLSYTTEDGTVVELSGAVNEFDFNGIDNVTDIKISNYIGTDISRVDIDFDLGFKLNSSSSLEDKLDLFEVSYENFENNITYNEDFDVNQSGTCQEFWIRDAYENNDRTGYSTTMMDYRAGDRRGIRLEINHLDISRLIVDDYKIRNIRYTLDPGMRLNPGTFGFFGLSDTPSNSQKVILENLVASNISPFYKNLVIIIDPNDINSILISFDLNLKTMLEEGTYTCDAPIDNLYLFLDTRVRNSASSSRGYDRVSTYNQNTNGSGFPNNDNNVINDGGLRGWRVRPEGVDIVTYNLKVLCPGDEQENEAFSPGSNALLRYEVININQDFVENMKISIPLPADFFDLSNNGENIDIQLSTKSNPNITGWTIDKSQNPIQLVNDDFILLGFDELNIDVTARVLESVIQDVPKEGLTFSLNFITQALSERTPMLSTSNQKTIVASNSSLCFPPPPCEDCLPSFAPTAGHEYLLSAWVKEAFVSTENIPVPSTYNNTGILISFNDGELVPFELFQPNPSEPIVDGWQRIERAFVIPEGAQTIVIELVNQGKIEAYFDDVRIHPLRSNMKSYVYDPSTQRLTAELDENNYSTFYEYDDEGNLIRVKKETERGVMTIQETRINQSKLNESVEFNNQKN